ncbi:MAG TPA: hypothetical protein VI911_11275 [Patescibacteria group bacterium]|nr:hypothetical protein [Patescibacteria group bacterium]
MGDKKDLVDNIKNHFGHEIVDQYVLNGSGKKEWFKYCRNCKVEVAEKPLERPTRDEQIENLQRSWAYVAPNIGQSPKQYQGLDLDLEVPLEDDEDEYGVFNKRVLNTMYGSLEFLNDTEDHMIDAIRYSISIRRREV